MQRYHWYRSYLVQTAPSLLAMIDPQWSPFILSHYFLIVNSKINIHMLISSIFNDYFSALIGVIDIMVDSKRYLMIVNTFSSSRPWRIQFGRFHYFHPRSAAGKSDKSWAKRYTRRFVKTQKKHFCWKTELVKTIPLCGNQSTSILIPKIGLFLLRHAQGTPANRLSIN